MNIIDQAQAPRPQDSGPQRFEIAINPLWPGEKLGQGNPRWWTYTRSFSAQWHTIDSLITDIRSGRILAHINDRTISYDPKGLSQSSFTQATEVYFRQKGNFPVVAAHILMAVHRTLTEDEEALHRLQTAMEEWAGPIR